MQARALTLRLITSAIAVPALLAIATPAAAQDKKATAAKKPAAEAPKPAADAKKPAAQPTQTAAAPKTTISVMSAALDKPASTANSSTAKAPPAKASPAKVPPGQAKKQVTPTQAVGVTREILVRHGYQIVRVETVEQAQVIYYRAGNQGRGRGHGPIQKMVVRPSGSIVTFEAAPEKVRLELKVQLGF